MCQARVFLVQDGEKTEIMRDVILVEEAEQGMHLYTFFEEPMLVHARVSRIDLLQHTVTLQSLEEGQDGDSDR